MKSQTVLGGDVGLKGFSSDSLFDLFDSLLTGPSLSVKYGFFSK